MLSFALDPGKSMVFSVGQCFLYTTLFFFFVLKYIQNCIKKEGELVLLRTHDSVLVSHVLVI